MAEFGGAGFGVAAGGVCSGAAAGARCSLITADELADPGATGGTCEDCVSDCALTIAGMTMRVSVTVKGVLEFTGLVRGIAKAVILPAHADAKVKYVGSERIAGWAKPATALPTRAFASKRFAPVKSSSDVYVMS